MAKSADFLVATDNALGQGEDTRDEGLDDGPGDEGVDVCTSQRLSRNFPQRD